jgi:SAM-dependent methyltransferase
MIQTNKPKDGNRRFEEERLVYFHKKADEKYWEEIWAPYANPEYYQPFKSGKLYTFEKIFSRHLPKHGKILEAGCGTAQYVVALNAKGYKCMGLDYEFQAMRTANTYAGPLRLACGDITMLGIADNTFEAIISLGVVEHRQSGPDIFLQEMRRILKPDGTLLISVPYFNDLRRWRARHGAYQDDVAGLVFYQYAFTRGEFCKILEANGYEIETTYSYSHQNTLSQELRWLKKIPAFLNKFIMRISKYIPYVNSDWGHMLMVVARKKE